MGSILRNFVLAPAAMAAAALTTNTAMAETTLKVPFSFTVDGKDLPAGLYSVQRQSSHNLVTLKSKDASQSFTWVVGPGEPAPTATAVILRFNELGESHALLSVQYGPVITSRLNKKTKQTEHMPTRIVPGQ
jgi:hypothetical protein